VLAVLRQIDAEMKATSEAEPARDGAARPSGAASATVRTIGGCPDWTGPGSGRWNAPSWNSPGPAEPDIPDPPSPEPLREPEPPEPEPVEAGRA